LFGGKVILIEEIIKGLLKGHSARELLDFVLLLSGALGEGVVPVGLAFQIADGDFELGLFLYLLQVFEFLVR
jgi:hypothetical protein